VSEILLTLYPLRAVNSTTSQLCGQDGAIGLSIFVVRSGARTSGLFQIPQVWLNIG